jgi:hypothetical protein
MTDDATMVINGRIEHGTVVLSESVSLPDGTEVTVVIQPSCHSAAGTENGEGVRVKLPLVPSKQPGSRKLNADRVAELLDDDELSG